MSVQRIVLFIYLPLGMYYAELFAHHRRQLLHSVESRESLITCAAFHAPSQEITHLFVKGRPVAIEFRVRVARLTRGGRLKNRAVPSQKSKKTGSAGRFAELENRAQRSSGSVPSMSIYVGASPVAAEPLKNQRLGPGDPSAKSVFFLPGPRLRGNVENDAPPRFHPTNGSFSFRQPSEIL